MISVIRYNQKFFSFFSFYDGTKIRHLLKRFCYLIHKNCVQLFSNE